ncbi:hypothetical protein JD969_05525 [Planctomycetota bacterium]|nr:hypothetical protein JD969_05525 [Planctomycetota bacterium]
MEWCKCAIAALFVIGVTGGTASAQLTSDASKVITFRNPGAGAHEAPSQSVNYYPRYRFNNQAIKTTRLVQRRIVDSSSLVSNGVAKQPTWPGFAEVRQGSITVYVDPHDVLLGQRAYENLVGGIDDKHSLRRAQRLFNALNQKPQVIVYRNENAALARWPKERFTPKSIMHIPVPDKFKKQRKRPGNYVELKQKVAKADKR